ncbi:MAG TPA: hypothetical protein VK919_00375 [Solirubrobacterales bacterium]|nr:hypothetical protein [Solirubrobacterales bacterium]
MSDGETPDRPDQRGVEAPFRYHLELSPAQLKITHTALSSLLDDFGHDEPEITALIRGVLAKLPDEHAIRAIQLEREVGGAGGSEPEPPSADGRPPTAA